MVHLGAGWGRGREGRRVVGVSMTGGWWLRSQSRLSYRQSWYFRHLWNGRRLELTRKCRSCEGYPVLLKTGACGGVGDRATEESRLSLVRSRGQGREKTRQAGAEQRCTLDCDCCWPYCSLSLHFSRFERKISLEKGHILLSVRYCFVHKYLWKLLLSAFNKLEKLRARSAHIRES